MQFLWPGQPLEAVFPPSNYIPMPVNLKISLILQTTSNTETYLHITNNCNVLHLILAFSFAAQCDNLDSLRGKIKLFEAFEIISCS